MQTRFGQDHLSSIGEHLFASLCLSLVVGVQAALGIPARAQLAISSHVFV